MIPFYLFYSMFGFQRVGDLIWAAADAQAKGFLLGCTAGRTTLNGEGLQHQDGHSQLVATTVPRLLAYDPAYAYEVAVIVQDGLRRMYQEDESVFYYLTLYNQSYPMPAMPEGAEGGYPAGHPPHRLASRPTANRRRSSTATARQRAHGAGSRAGSGDPGRPVRNRQRPVERDQLQPAVPRSEGNAIAGISCTRKESPRTSYLNNVSMAWKARSSPSPTS